MLSIPHLIIIFVVALVVFGPEKLPELARNLGKVMAEFKRATGDLRSTFEGHLKDLEREADQRRIGASVASSPSAAPAPVPAPDPATGTVPTLPHHIIAPVDGTLENSSDAIPVAKIEPLPPEPTSSGEPIDAIDPVVKTQKIEPDSETVSDGGTRPA
jgi:sec-independent protein translocase protein TatB